MDPNHLIVYKSPFSKVRLGKDYDGGYVICDIPNQSYSLLISGGVCDDISFEEDFIRLFNVPCVAFDGTVSGLPPSSFEHLISFIQKNIGPENSDAVTNMHQLIETGGDHLFLKMDIEGAEFPWFESLTKSHLNRFDQMVVEFHYPFSERESSVFQKINRTHVLVHFHGNAVAGVRIHNSIVFPNVFECTYLHKRHFKKPLQLSDEIIPSCIDMCNGGPAMSDIFISYPPFVWR